MPSPGPQPSADRRRASPRLFSVPERTQISVVVPVHDEEQTLLRLHARLAATLDRMRRSWEVIYVDDGSRDGSLLLLRGLSAADPRVVIVELLSNFGQHAAVMAGFERCAGEVVVTMDADLQHPPEEIPSLVHALEQGSDVAAGRRDVDRGERLWKRLAGATTNRVASHVLRGNLTDWTCMMRAYRREVVARMMRTREVSGFIPALAATCGRRISEVPVRQEARQAGRSKYRPLRLAELNRDLITGFTTAPLDAIFFAGLACLSAAALGAAGLAARWVAQGVAPGTVTALAVAMAGATGAVLVAVGIVAAYVGRLHRQLLGRPRQVISRIHHAGSCEIIEA